MTACARSSAGAGTPALRCPGGRNYYQWTASASPPGGSPQTEETFLQAVNVLNVLVRTMFHHVIALVHTFGVLAIDYDAKL